MFVSPMLLQKIDIPFDDEDFITELKLDGIRLILSKFDNKIKLYTRHNNEVTSKFPELLTLDLPNGIVLDGEIVVSDEQGKPDFEAMMERFMSSKSTRKIQYCVFDVLYHEGKKVAHMPLVERKVLLDDLIEQREFITKVQWMYGNGEAYFNLVKEHGLEGIVLKRADSPYQVNKRSKDWLKVINYQYVDAYIIGARKDEFGLLLGLEEGKKIRPAGIMEFMNPVAKKVFYNTHKNFIKDEDKKFIFLDPKMKCRIKFRNYTKDGKLRIPSFVEYIS
ncbi:RNA ligase family protein [Neobacillus sp. SuZ13]|uniref:ATP-dependent DNA ligase n=1 Tax=Neobacillus sp. SuZ13 TaxID=3047875 RepID=UPI0024C00B42|nr:RNA ligase family protein [Neobacillus sp. SuZ13]WHY65363.1 RNA ligase family protein [Neobacillus sp. SuZ13]